MASPTISAQPTQSYPTVLIAVDDDETRQFLVHRLREDKWHTLEANNRSRMMDLVRFHSRPIHLLLLSVDISEPSCEALLQDYRSAMHVLYVKTGFHEGRPDALLPERAVAKSREILKPLQSGG
jgi:hypothetical protein